jgi:hypothetical protein
MSFLRAILDTLLQFLDKIRLPDGTIDYRSATPDEASPNRGTDPG